MTTVTSGKPRATLQLIARSDQVRDLLQRHGHNPKLQLSLSFGKSIARIIDHLMNKWTDSVTKQSLAHGSTICLWPRRTSSKLVNALPVCSNTRTIFNTPATVQDLFDDAYLTSPLVIEYDWYIAFDQASFIFEQFEECFASPISPPQTSPPQEVQLDENSRTLLDLKSLLTAAAVNTLPTTNTSSWVEPDIQTEPTCQEPIDFLPSSPVRDEGTSGDLLLETIPHADANLLMGDSWLNDESSVLLGNSKKHSLEGQWSPPSSPLKRRRTDVDEVSAHPNVLISTNESNTTDWFLSLAF